MESFIDLFNVHGEIHVHLEFLWHTALRASEDYVNLVQYLSTMSEESLMAWCMEDLLPWMHMTTDLKIAKDSLHLNQSMRELYGTSRFKD